MAPTISTRPSSSPTSRCVLLEFIVFISIKVAFC
jgi:hypothetical protein